MRTGMIGIMCAVLETGLALQSKLGVDKVGYFSLVRHKSTFHTWLGFDTYAQTCQ